jgi:hypothetical protein
MLFAAEMEVDEKQFNEFCGYCIYYHNMIEKKTSWV